MEALSISCDNFGENNIQTAKHFGNLGRLLQTMKKFKVRKFINKHYALKLAGFFKWGQKKSSGQ